MTTLRKAAQQALSYMESVGQMDMYAEEWSIVEALRAALAEHDKDREYVEQLKANWALQRKLAEETAARDRQQREYEEAKMAALAESVQEPVNWTGCGDCDCSFPCHLGQARCLRLPPLQRPPLTDEEIEEFYFNDFRLGELKEFARAIERAHGIGSKT